MEVPRHVTLSLTQGEGNHTLPCFPSQTEHFLLLFVLIVCVTISKRTVYHSVEIGAAGKSRPAEISSNGTKVITKS